MKKDAGNGQHIPALVIDRLLLFFLQLPSDPFCFIFACRLVPIGTHRKQVHRTFGSYSYNNRKSNKILFMFANVNKRLLQTEITKLSAMNLESLEIVDIKLGFIVEYL